MCIQHTTITIQSDLYRYFYVEEMIVALTYLVVLGLAAGVHGYGNGAAPTACVPMRVAHGVPQAGPSPYSISLPNGQTTYSVGHQVKRK